MDILLVFGLPIEHVNVFCPQRCHWIFPDAIMDFQLMLFAPLSLWVNFNVQVAFH